MTRNQYPGELSPKPQQPGEITMDEAAALLGVTKGSVASAVSLGRLPSRLVRRTDGRPGRGMRLVQRADVEAYALNRSAPRPRTAADDPEVNRG